MPLLKPSSEPFSIIGANAPAATFCAVLGNPAIPSMAIFVGLVSPCPSSAKPLATPLIACTGLDSLSMPKPDAIPSTPL